MKVSLSSLSGVLHVVLILFFGSTMVTARTSWSIFYDVVTPTEMLCFPLISDILLLILLNELSQEPMKYNVKNVQLSIQEWDHLYLKYAWTKVSRGDSQVSTGML